MREGKEKRKREINYTRLDGATDDHTGVSSHEAHGEAFEEAH